MYIYVYTYKSLPINCPCFDQVSALLDEILATHYVDTTCIQLYLLYLYVYQVGGYTEHPPNRGCMNTATIRCFTLPLKRFLDRVSLAHFVISVIQLPVTVEFSQLFQAKL